jgi:4-hydroxyphenylpyruvate dioxygenase
VVIQRLGFVELWVGNARQAAAFLSSMLGFTVVGRAGPRTGRAHEVSYVLTQGGITIVVTGAADASSPVAEFVSVHGDGVRNLALVVDDVAAAHERAVEAGFPSVSAPADGDGAIAVVGAFGDAVHTLIGPAAGPDEWLEGFEPPEVGASPPGPAVGVHRLDHYAVSVEAGDREKWAERYALGFGLVREPDDEHVNVDGSAFSMTTVRFPAADNAFVFAEPVPGSRKSQIASYLEQYNGPGVHHIALGTTDIASTVRALHARGLRTLRVPDSYHDDATARLAGLDVPWPALAELGIVVDVDDDGHLLQAFTEPLGDRPTTYFEIIQREGTRGFGTDNVRHLYSEVVREQLLIDAGRSQS